MKKMYVNSRKTIKNVAWQKIPIRCVILKISVAKYVRKEMLKE